MVQDKIILDHSPTTLHASAGCRSFFPPINTLFEPRRTALPCAAAGVRDLNDLLHHETDALVFIARPLLLCARGLAGSIATLGAKALRPAPSRRVFDAAARVFGKSPAHDRGHHAEAFTDSSGIIASPACRRARRA